MLKSARQTQIRKLVEANGHVTVSELKRVLDVSEATIRRDLEALDQSGWVRRTHGGAVQVTRAGKEPPILQRQVKYQAEKQLIGQRAAAMVKEGQTIFFGSGTTVFEVARHIRNVPDLTVITNALNVVNELVECDNIELIVIGGMVRQSELSMVGHIAEQDIREFRAHKVFMGMRGIDPQHGFTSDYLPEAITDRAILSIAPRNIVVADHSKLGRVSTVFLAPITAAHVLITDQAAPPEIVSEMEEQGLEVQLVNLE
jgi:DeoR family transcriptional regulator of aga operon